MSLLKRKPRPLGRVLQNRDDRIFFIAIEDEYAPAQYFGFLRFKKACVKIIPSSGGRSGAGHVLQNIIDYRDLLSKNHELLDSDEFWILLDTDHWVKGHHRPSLLRALARARVKKIKAVMSNPSFELWLLLHVKDGIGLTADNCADLEQMLRAENGSYDKTNLNPEHYPKSSVPLAINRAKAMEPNSGAPVGHWTEGPGTRLYLLVEKLLKYGFLP